MLKYSRQREGVLQNVLHRCDHPTADMVYEDMRSIYPNISLGTVYRNLTLLSEMGEINKISVPGSPDRFDGNLKPHMHFKCRLCAGFWDMVPDESEDLLKIHLPEYAAKVESCSLQYYGICAACEAKEQQIHS